MSERTPQSAVPDREHLTAALDSLPSTRRKILDHIKRQDSASSEQIAGALGITASATRQHLSALTADGLIQYQIQRSGPGRPTHRYSLTGAGDALFPRNYVDLTNELLSYIEEDDAELLARVFDKRGLARLARAQVRVNGLAFPEKVAMVARILDEDGYLADFTELADGSFRLTEHNCAVLAIAQRYQHACRTEIEFLQALLPEADVVRVAHRLKSGHICSYEITPR
jgi:DeoR family transcriptional regulator, suf operon transcriptional repressor